MRHHTSIEQWGTAVWNEDMRSAFHGARNLNINPSAGTPNMSAVTSMRAMFANAHSFNSDIGDWDTAAVTDMSYMFNSATSFNQDIGSWNVSALTAASGMFSGETLSPANYAALLIGWSRDELTLRPNVSFDGGNSKYCSPEAEAARTKIISSPSSWIITDGGECTAPRISTTEATLVATTSTTLNGDIASDGGKTILERGFLYSTSSSADLEITDAGGTATGVVKVVSSGTETGAFSKGILITNRNPKNWV